jgi:hypothetical protein
MMEQESHGQMSGELESQSFQEENFSKRLWTRITTILLDFHEYNFFKKKPYILTPCMHVFHTECLERWLKLKRECPTDRTVIPPIES